MKEHKFDDFIAKKVNQYEGNVFIKPEVDYEELWLSLNKKKEITFSKILLQIAACLIILLTGSNLLTLNKLKSALNTTLETEQKIAFLENQVKDSERTVIHLKNKISTIKTQTVSSNNPIVQQFERIIYVPKTVVKENIIYKTSLIDTCNSQSTELAGKLIPIKNSDQKKIAETKAKMTLPRVATFNNTEEQTNAKKFALKVAFGNNSNYTHSFNDKSQRILKIRL